MTNTKLFLHMKPLFSVMASTPDVGVSSLGIGSWSDREMAVGRKLTGIAIEKEKYGNYIDRIRAR